jgi:predicted esterase
VLSSTAVVAAVGIVTPWSPLGWALLGATAVAGLALVVRGVRVRRGVGALSAALMIVALIGHGVAASSGRARALVLPSGAAAGWLVRIVDEQDLGQVGAWALLWRWPLAPGESDGLLRAFHSAYVDMRSDVGPTPTPAPGTLAGLQSPSRFDTIVIEPPTTPRAALVFLHGYGGSFTLQCWMLAQAARAISATTVCPATGFSGHWSERDGERTLRATIEYLHGRGLRRVYLAGLSNGAVGASELAPQFAPFLAGLVLISGAPAGGSAVAPGFPILVIHGERDASMPALAAHAFVARTRATYVGFEDAGHFVLLTRRADAREAIIAWLRRVEGSSDP